MDDGDAMTPGSGNGGAVKYPLPERELIVVADAEVAMRAGDRLVRSAAGADLSDLNSVLEGEDVSLEPIFGPSEDRVRAEGAALDARAGPGTPDLSVYYRVRAEDERLQSLAESLSAARGVRSAYVKPAVEPAGAGQALLERTEPTEAPPMTPDFRTRQGYLRPAPEGVDAVYAAQLPGGRGTGVGIIDIEGAWNFGHEDLTENQGGVVGGTPTSDLAWRNHGTAVVGVLGADANTQGVTGISPDAQVRAISIFGGLGSSSAIHQAANLLKPGDIILIELHRPGPRYDFQPRTDQAGYIPLEWWPDDLDAIRYATDKGVIVVEAAGNGSENLDDGIYDEPARGFPSGWKNPFHPNNPSSHAVVVGAGAPPPGTHGRDHGPDRSRLEFSNYGHRVDAQGWGREVTTTGGRGYGPGDLQGGQETVWYTDTFSGTSSASPLVVGSLACMQGFLRSARARLLTPKEAIRILRETGSAQQDGPGRPATQSIGRRPDVRAAVERLLARAVESGTATSFWDQILAYPPGQAASLWLHVGGAWRRWSTPSPHDRALVRRALNAGGGEVRVWYTGSEVVGLAVTGA